ncbi:DUF3501 family protein [Sneathiella chinensis]|uniref:DUF3501 domain-containing protein n=1 Tax=Sneathiella chinensis TaxID=349750 RepID=A0ABQ5U1G0_9PROT|nr:DUF3501 family protein [Sneathiella chinensis]GLQ05187.1 hypothetical protein GCM10007924_04080 [Sneathiella chinensis]
MTALKKEITRDDIMPVEDYARIRKEHKTQLVALKKPRRVSVGPFATFYFENYATMWAQIHEMLYIEGGGEEQITDELTAYNPLIPNGSELVATLMLEIDDPVRRDYTLRQLGHIEEAVYLQINDEKIYATAEQEVERTTPDGKTSSIHFLHFPLSEAQKRDFKISSSPIILGIEHANYGHMAMLGAATREALAEDFD